MRDHLAVKGKVNAFDNLAAKEKIKVCLTKIRNSAHVYAETRTDAIMEMLGPPEGRADLIAYFSAHPEAPKKTSILVKERFSKLVKVVVGIFTHS